MSLTDVLAVTTSISSTIPKTQQVAFIAIPSTIAATTSNEEATVAATSIILTAIPGQTTNNVATVATTSIIPAAIPATSSNKVATVATNVLHTTMFQLNTNKVSTIISTTPITVPATTVNVVHTSLKTTDPITTTTATTTLTTVITTTTTTTVKMQMTVPSCVANNPNYLGKIMCVSSREQSD